MQVKMQDLMKYKQFSEISLWLMLFLAEKKFEFKFLKNDKKSEHCLRKYSKAQQCKTWMSR